MNKTLMCLLSVMIVGCGSPSPVFKAQRFDDSKAAELAKQFRGKTEYAPKQYADFAYDSTGVYGNLNGMNVPGVISVEFTTFKKADRHIISMHRLYFASDPDCFTPLKSIEIASASDKWIEHLFKWEDSQFKWIEEPDQGQLVGPYGGTFWVSWKSLGLEGPPVTEGFCVWVRPLERTHNGASISFETADKK